MDARKLFLATAAVAAASALQAMPAAVPHLAAVQVGDDSDVPLISDAARAKILGSANIHKTAAVNGQPFFSQAGPPTWAQWRGQFLQANPPGQSGPAGKVR